MGQRKGVLDISNPQQRVEDGAINVLRRQLIDKRRMPRADKDLQGMVGLRHETGKKGRTDMIVPWIESPMEKYLIVDVHSLPPLLQSYRRPVMRFHLKNLPAQIAMKG